jgi:hypothetical protein
MARIVLTAGNVVLREVVLVKGRITIGRGSHNDIVLDDRAVSAEHLAIVMVNDDSFLEDLNSTNGTQVNGQPVKKHFLRDGDVVELARYRIEYVQDVGGEGLRSIVATNSYQSLQIKRRPALIKVINGPNAGKEIVLAKTITTVGHSNAQMVVIARRLQEYYLTYVKGSEATVNGRSIRGESVEMINGDIIDLSGIRLQFINTISPEHISHSVNYPSVG